MPIIGGSSAVQRNNIFKLAGARQRQGGSP
jgi:hypothetical protein